MPVFQYRALDGAGNPLRFALDTLPQVVPLIERLVADAWVAANDAQALTPGQFLNVSLTLDLISGAVTVPAAAVQQGPEGSLVFVVKPDDTVEARSVVVALRQGGMAVIERGLRDGETVVTDGQLRLSPGARVQIKTGGG